MKSRILIAIAGAPLLIYVLLFGQLSLLLLANIVIGGALYEFYRMINKSGKKTHSYIGICAGLIIPNLIYFLNLNSLTGLENFKIFNTNNTSSPEIIVLIATVIILFTYRIATNKITNTISEISSTMLGIIYISIMFTYAIKLKALPNGGKILLLTQMTIWICDSAAYFVGMLIGKKYFKRRLSRISPNKSIEGFIGGIVFSLLFVTPVLHFMLDFKLIYGIIFPLIISFVGQIGDLAESLLKRECGVKDSGTLLAGHGGILDRFDSIIFVLPIAYYLYINLF